MTYEIACSFSSLLTSCTVSSELSYCSSFKITFTCSEERLSVISETSACFLLSLGDNRLTAESLEGVISLKERKNNKRYIADCCLAIVNHFR